MGAKNACNYAWYLYLAAITSSKVAKKILPKQDGSSKVSKLSPSFVFVQVKQAL